LAPGTVPQQASLASRLDHPHLARVYASFEHAGNHYLVTEYVDGASLVRVIEKSGRLRPEQALEVLRGALQALAHAHAVGLAHGNLKPENVIVDRRGTAKLVDFGLSGPAEPLADIRA